VCVCTMDFMSAGKIHSFIQARDVYFITFLQDLNIHKNYLPALSPLYTNTVLPEVSQLYLPMIVFIQI